MKKYSFKRLKKREVQKRIGLILGSKMIAVVLLLGGIKLVAFFLGDAAGASPLQATAVKANDIINPINTVWTLVTAYLVFFMQAGFMGLEAGFARSRESVNIMMECIFDTCICGLMYFLFGFAFQFGSNGGATVPAGHGSPIIGHQFFLLHGMTAAYGTTGVSFLAFFLFQFAFADTASTVTSGAMVGRTSFKGDILYSICVSGFIYPIFGHWVWGGGWLGTTMGWFHGLVPSGVFFRDFAGSTVVHTVGGVISLAGAIVLGPRLGRKFKRDGGGPTPPHDINIAAIGGVILWFGWYGFNPGSTLSAMDWEGIGRISGNTTLAACAGGLMAVLFVYPRSKKWDVGMSINGFLGGLVAITCPCYWVDPAGAIFIGLGAGIVVPLGVDLLEHLRIDDPIGAVAVHGVAGVWGTLSLGLFATGKYGIPTPTGVDTFTVVKGLFYGGGTGQLVAQFIGSATCCLLVGGVAFVVMLIVKQMPGEWGLRLAPELELEGIDIVEHGSPAYHMEFGQGFSYTTYTGKSATDGSSIPASSHPDESKV